MPVKIFISYSRRNKYIADRLCSDLRRANLEVWMDTRDIPADAEWEQEIRQAIERSTHIVLLASPESAASGEVKKELDLAGDRPRFTLHVGGAISDLPAEWTKKQIIPMRDRYPEALQELLRSMITGATSLPMFRTYLNGSTMTTDEVCQALGGGVIERFGQLWCKVPVQPFGYSTIWLLAPSGTQFILPSQIAVLFWFSGETHRHTEDEVLKFWKDRQPTQPWLVYVEGPFNAVSRFYELGATHQWSDAIDASLATLNLFGKDSRREVHLFFNCPIPIAYAVGGKMREMIQCHLYQFNRGTQAEMYQLVYNNRH